jgi:SET domain-containing protein
MDSKNKHQWRMLIRRIKKTAIVMGNKIENVMWGLFTLEDIPAGAYVVEYTGEVLTAKEGDKRGKIYDEIGMSYLFDMNDPDESDEYDMRV